MATGPDGSALFCAFLPLCPIAVITHLGIPQAVFPVGIRQFVAFIDPALAEALVPIAGGATLGSQEDQEEDEKGKCFHGKKALGIDLIKMFKESLAMIGGRSGRLQ